MWQDLSCDITAATIDNTLHDKKEAKSKRDNFYETDSSDTFTSVDDSSPPRSPPEKKGCDQFTTLGINFDSKHKGECPQDNENVGNSTNDTQTKKNDTAVPSRNVTHPPMPPLIKKMPSVNIPVSRQQNSFSLLESPINRNIVSDSSNHDLEIHQSAVARNINANITNNMNNNTNKPKRKKGKSREVPS